MMTAKRTIGLIAGNGKFPFLFAQAARDKGLRIVAVAIQRNTSPRLKSHVDDMKWFRVSEFCKVIDFLHKSAIKEVVMAGQIKPRTLFEKEILRDEVLRAVIADLKDRRADSIFGGIAQHFQSAGITVLDSVLFLEKYLPKKGMLTQHHVSKEVWDDVMFGFELAKEVGRLDIGQTVVVKNKAIIAVEAMEGTDAAIRRAGMIVPRGCVVVKVAKPKQDKRFDIPVVGLRTIQNLNKIKAACLAIEAEKTLIIDQKACIAKAERARIAIIAV